MASNAYSSVECGGYADWLKPSLHKEYKFSDESTPFDVDFKGEPKFLIDASVFPGSSGSPVFLIDRVRTDLGQGSVNLYKPRIFFLGIISAVYTRTDLFDLVKVADIKVSSKQMIDLGVVYKSAEVRWLIKYYLL